MVAVAAMDDDAVARILANLADRADEPVVAIIVTITPANLLDLLHRLRHRLGRLRVLVPLGAADAGRFAGLDIDVPLDLHRTIGMDRAIDMHAGRVTVRALDMDALRPALGRIVIAFRAFAMRANAAIAGLGIGRGRQHRAGHQQGDEKLTHYQLQPSTS
jgi:hypothetical protein